jgi:PHD/YefM family antitoxin component YafN of YafNO toxin-antitoxin module
MYQVTVDYAKKNLDELCHRATKESEGVAIISENRSYVLIAQEEWESLIETAMIMQTPNILQQIEIARQE